LRAIDSGSGIDNVSAFHSQVSVALPSADEHRENPDSVKIARGVPSWKLTKPIPDRKEAKHTFRGRSSYTESERFREFMTTAGAPEGYDETAIMNGQMSYQEVSKGVYVDFARRLDFAHLLGKPLGVGMQDTILIPKLFS